MTEQATIAARDDLSAVEDAFVRFAAARATAADPDAAWREGAFSQYPGAGEPDLFGMLDIAYAGHILRVVDGRVGAAERVAWAEAILARQDDDGWFRAGDRQGHGPEHATAYALGALQILLGEERAPLARLKPLRALGAQLARDPGARVPPFALSLLDRVHFWRGSHRAGGIAAIVRGLHMLGLDTEALLGIRDARQWLDGWWAWFEPRIDPQTGYWRLAPAPLQAAFDLAYRRRHDPVLARMGGAVHLYWVALSMGRSIPHPAAMVATTSALIGADGLYEREPYCIDLDANFLIARSLPGLRPRSRAREAGRRALALNRNAIVSWFTRRDPSLWHPSSHRLPGAFAAVAEADWALDPGRARWRDVFEEVCWL